MITRLRNNKQYAHYAQWAVHEIEDQVLLDCTSLRWSKPERYSDWIRHLEKYLYFVVVTLKPVASNTINSTQRGYSADVCAGEFKVYYKNICRHLIGSRWNRKKALQPFAFCSLDAENSRGSHGPAINWKTGKNIHVNALVLAHPEADPTNKNLDWKASIPKHSRIDSVKVSRYDSDSMVVNHLQMSQSDRTILPALRKPCRFLQVKTSEQPR